MQIVNELKLNFDDVLIVPNRNNLRSRSQVDLIRKFQCRNGGKFEGVPIIAANMATGNFSMLKQLAKHQMFTAISKHRAKEWLNDEDFIENLTYGFYTIGIRDDAEINQLSEFYKFCEDHLIDDYSDEFKIPLKVMIDVPNGYISKLADTIKLLRDKFVPSNMVLCAGNVCTPNMAEELILSGADIVKCGIGPGGHCSTRKITGVGYPQLSAIIETVFAVHGLNGLLIADGGCTVPGDICKAFCANSDMVMLGTMLAGTDECDGKIITRNFITDEVEEKWNKNIGEYVQTPIIQTKKFKLFMGLSSDKAQAELFGGIKDYRASEGHINEVPYIGSVDIPVRNILGGLRSCGTYIGAWSIKNFGKCATFVRTNKQK